jgi:bacillithiol synthase
LTAVRLAAQLSEQGIPAVPMFWLATEDHDVAEVNHTFVFGPDHGAVPLSVDVQGGSERPVGGISIPEPPLDRLREALAGFPYGQEVAEMVRLAYPPGATFGGAFRALLERLLEGRGLLFVDPLDESVRRLAAPLLREAVRQDEKLHGALIERGKQLESAGYHAQVHVEAKTSLVFLLDNARRATLRRQNGAYASKEKPSGERRYSASELMDRAEQLSPNALLRPVVQDYVLPTVAYVGGPAELAYMAQSQVLYSELLGRMPVMVSRGGFTLLDGRTGKLMERYALSLPDFFHGEDGIRDLVAQKLVPPALTQEFGRAGEAVSNSLEGLRDDLKAFDATLAASADKSLAKIRYQLSKLQRKTARESLKRNERASADARYMSGLIVPERHLQERYYSILPFAARYGVGDLMDRLYQHLRLECPDHQVLAL